jgi:transaldolase
MNATLELHNLGQSLWLDNITRDLLDNGTLKHQPGEPNLLSIRPSVYVLERCPLPRR